MKKQFYIINEITGKFFSSQHSGFVKNYSNADIYYSVKYCVYDLNYLRNNFPKSKFIIVQLNPEFVPIKGF
jgi:hypothetical protein